MRCKCHGNPEGLEMSDDPREAVCRGGIALGWEAKRRGRGVPPKEPAGATGGGGDVHGACAGRRAASWEQKACDAARRPE